MHRYSESQREIEGLRLGCGKYSIERFTSILRLYNINYEISAMGWIGNRIVIDIVSKEKDGKKITLYITKRIDTQPSLIKTKHIDIYYNSIERDEKFVSHILSLDLSKLNYNELVNILKNDPELGNPSLALPSFESPIRPENHLDSWGGKDLYANFFAEGEISRAQLDSVNIYKNCVFIQHSDIECVSLKPNLDLRIIRFLVKYPWLSDNREKYVGINREELPDNNKFFSTDLNEKDVILGHNKVRDVINYALSNIKRKNIFFSNTCTPVVIGEDVESVIKQASKKKKNLLFLTVTPQSMEVVLKTLFRPRNKIKQKINKNSINLLGYEKDNYLEKLSLLLKKIGIKVNSTVIPDVSSKELKKYYNGGIDIIKPNAIWSHLYSQLNSSSSHKLYSIDAPYGFKGTLKWIKDLSNILNLKIDDKDIIKFVNPDTINIYESLKDKMKEIGIIFVIRKNEEIYLTDTAKTWGVPLLRFFMEMGSRIEILIKASSRDDAKVGAEKILNILTGYNNFEIRFFESFDMMSHLLSKSRCQLVFSNHSNDWRVSAAGKNIISLTDFEIGLDGAIYSMKRILKIAKNPFFPTYSLYLRRNYIGVYEKE